MSRRFQYVCDVHGLNDEFVEIDGDASFGFDGQWYMFGLCPKCDNELAEPIRALIVEHGIKVRESDLKPVKKAANVRAAAPTVNSAPDEKQQCLWCPYDGSTVAALQAHIKRHGFNGFQDGFGSTCPVCKTPGLKVMGMHAPTHEVATVPELFQLALKLGDPHGIVGKRIAAGQD